MAPTLTLMKMYADHRGIALTTLGRLAAKSTTVAERIAGGHVTLATIERIDQWLSDHWPDGELEWPDGIERPRKRDSDRPADAAA